MRQGNQEWNAYFAATLQAFEGQGGESWHSRAQFVWLSLLHSQSREEWPPRPLCARLGELSLGDPAQEAPHLKAFGSLCGESGVGTGQHPGKSTEGQGAPHPRALRRIASRLVPGPQRECRSTAGGGVALLQRHERGLSLGPGERASVCGFNGQAPVLVQYDYRATGHRCRPEAAAAKGCSDRCPGARWALLYATRGRCGGAGAGMLLLLLLL